MNSNIFNSADEVLVAGLLEICSRGKNISPRGLTTKEIESYDFTLLNPRARLINIKARKWDFSYAIGELCWHLRASDRLDEITYYSKAWRNFSDNNKTIPASCYGKQIFAHSDSRWEKICTLLKYDPDTRRAEIRFGDGDDLLGVDVSCVTSIHFMLRNNKLNCITHMRSNDIILGLCYDLFFITFLQEMLAVELGVELGVYRHIADSFHFYDRHSELVKNILAEGTSGNSGNMEVLTDLESLNLFLEIEETIRMNNVLSLDRLNLLPKYWRNLTIPLLEKQQKVNEYK